MRAKKEMTLERLTITSGHGKPSMVLEADAQSGMPSIYFWDDTGLRFRVGMAGDGFPNISMQLANGENVLSLHAADEGYIAIVLNYHNGNPALHVVVRPDENIEVTKYDREGRLLQ